MTGCRRLDPEQTAKIGLSEHSILRLKLASFVVIAITLSFGLGSFVIGNLSSMKSGFMEAARSVSNVLAPVKPQDSAEPQSASGADSANLPLQQNAKPATDPTASALREIKGARPQKPTGAMSRPGYEVQEESLEGRAARRFNGYGE